MRKFTVVMESYESENSKRVTVVASNEYDAMAEAQMRFPGWMPVDVEAA